MTATPEIDVGDIVRPRPVRPGDVVAIVSPSAPAVAWWPHRVERATRFLESLGLRVRLMPHAALATGWVAGPAEARAEDIHLAFADDDVAVVLCGIGGNHSVQLLPHLDFDLISTHPKIFQGYSDATVLHAAFLRRARLSTLYGPAFTTELAEFPEVLGHTRRFLERAWFGTEPLDFTPAAMWTDEFLDFDEQADLIRPRTLMPSSGWQTIRGGEARGPTIGGCLDTIVLHVRGTPSWGELDGRILVIETSESCLDLSTADAYLSGLAVAGVFERVAGLIVARPYGPLGDDADALWALVEEHTRTSGIPVLANVECGHADPMISLPLGLPASLDAGLHIFRVLVSYTDSRVRRVHDRQ